MILKNVKEFQTKNQQIKYNASRENNIGKHRDLKIVMTAANRLLEEKSKEALGNEVLG